MEILHHFGIKLSSDHGGQEFADLGIKLEPATRLPNGNIITSFEIGEHDPRWTIAQRLAARFQLTEFVRTEFAESEVNAAKTMCIFASSQQGYPEPSEKFGFMAATFDLSDYCRKCGVGRRQIRPFRIKPVPNLKRKVMQLNWILDEYFVTREVWEEVFQPFGIGCWPVVIDGTEEESESVVQIRVDHYAELRLDEANETTCSSCGRKKMKMELRGFSPNPVSVPAPVFKSIQYFGSDAAAFRRVLITSSLYQKIKWNELYGIEFYPCAPE